MPTAETVIGDLIVVLVIVFVILTFWARMMGKDIIGVLYDIKDYVSSFKGEAE